MPKIYDNIENNLVVGLNNTLSVSYRSDFCVGYFNLRGWKEVANEIERFEGNDDKRCRLLVGMQKLPLDIIKDYFSKVDANGIDNKEALNIKKRLAQEFKEQLTIGVPTEADEQGLRKLSAQIKKKKVSVKLFLRHTLHAKLYLLFRDDQITPLIGYVGSSNLTLAGLVKQGELNVDVLEQDAAQKLSKWFDDRWDDRWCLDISDELAEIIDTSWAADKLYQPYHIYLKMAYHLSREARAGLTEFKIPKIFKEELLDFQQKALLETNVKLFPINTILVAMYGEGKTRGQASILKIESTTNQACAALVNESLSDIVRNYVYLFCLSQYEQIRMISVGGNQPNLNLTKVKLWKINIPPFEEQKEIVERVEALFKFSDEIEERYKKAKAHVDKLT